MKTGRGGDARIATLLGLETGTVARGRRALLEQDVEIDRVRRAGGGRKRLGKRLPDRIYGCNWFYEGQFTLLARRNVSSFRAVASAERCSVCVA